MFTASQVDKWLSAWKTVSGRQWADDFSFLPRDLSKEEADVAKHEIRSMRDVFYTTFKLPVITPDNVKEWMTTMKAVCPDYLVLWTWFSGSSTLAAVMMHGPFYLPAMFPVDLRFGWNIANPAHQKLLMEVDAMYRPFITTKEVRCKYWSQAGFLRDPDKTSKCQKNERATH